MAGIRADHPFSLTRGGPLHHLLSRCRLVDARGRVRWFRLAAFAWLPLLPAALLELAIDGSIDTVILDPTMHVRMLVMLPLLVGAEQLLEVRCERVAHHVREEGLVDRTSWAVILDRAEHLRDSRLVEAVLALVVLALGQAALWGIAGWGAYVHGLDVETRFSFVRVWCLALALPFVQFFLLRWLWRWLVWTYVVVRLSHHSLSLNAMHPDGAAGLKPLGAPIDAFAVFLAANFSVASAAWMTEIHERQATLQGISSKFFGLVVIAMVVACGPLLLFLRQLYSARHRDEAAYHLLARRYVDDFRRKWIVESSGAQALGTPDIQSLNDLGGSYKTTEATRLYPFGMRALVNLWAGAVAPMLPLVFMTTPISEIGKHVGHIVFGV